jgi:4,5-DOPA dioxygenase extradiol
MPTLPSLFVSHGAPTLILEDVPARSFLSTLGRHLGRPDAIVAISAHHVAHGAVVSAAPQLSTVHDFHGFPAELYRIRYEPKGDPALARDLAARLRSAGLPITETDDAGLDHGAWVPLALMYPLADIPVVPLSLDASMDEREHVAIGRALAPLRERNVLVLASGGFTHNLREFGRHRRDAAPEPYVVEFRKWMSAAMSAGDEALLDWRNKAPHAARAHPTPEHLMPLFVACGAGGPNRRVEHLHDSTTYGMLAMDAFAFH